MMVGDQQGMLSLKDSAISFELYYRTVGKITRVKIFVEH